MATLIQQKRGCMTCGKPAGMFTCRGCSKIFCLDHTNEHRQSLDKQMNEILFNHNRIKEHMASQKSNQYHQELMTQVDRWEKQSVDKIHQTANEIREHLTANNREHHDYMGQQLTKLAQQINKARIDGDFFENELKQWTVAIQSLQRTLAEQQNIRVSQISTASPFISKLSLGNKPNVTTQQLKQWFDYEASPTQVDSSINSNLQDKYLFGDHLFRFKLELYERGSLVLMGIISASKSTYGNPYKNPTFYGWSSNNLVYLHGIAFSNFNDYHSDIEKNDVFQLVIDCDRRLIRLTNERTYQSYELSIDINQCPLPWQPHVHILNNFE